MKPTFKDTLRNYALIQRVGAFVMTLVIIGIFLPKEQLYKYEHQLNQPWRHEKLLAPFDFGIRKTKEEVQMLKAEAEASQPPVFRVDEAASAAVLADIEQAFSVNFPDTSSQCTTTLQQGLELVSGFLQQGIIGRGHEVLQPIDPAKEVTLLHEGVLQTTPLGQLPAMEDVVGAVNDFARGGGVCALFFVRAVTGNLRPNTTYDDSLTTVLRQRAVEEVINIRGSVAKGTTIIDKGDMVDENTLRILESLKLEYEERAVTITRFRWSFFGEMGIVFTLLTLLAIYIYAWQRKTFNDPRPLTLALALIAILFAMSRLAGTGTAISVYAIPIGIAPLLLRMFYDFTVSLFTLVVLVLLVAVFSANPLEFALIQTSAVSVATLYQASSTKRSKMLGTVVVVFAGYSLIYVFMSLAQNGSWSGVDTVVFGWFAINALLCTLVFPLIYLVEKVFGYVSETTLLELGDSNQPLLKELAIKAPGTFQHSLQVANLCEKVASRIGGKAVLLRTAALYHDIGKMNEPLFFIENQLPENNAHDDLEPEESAAIIIGHVAKGVELARQQNLPMEVINFIRTHHGTGTVRFFLKRAREKAGSPDGVDESPFRYPGPTPKTKEQAILMMCDSVEAATRSLKQHTSEAIAALVDDIVDRQRAAGQFDEAPITLRDISQAKEVLKTSLRGIYHTRVAY